MAGSRFASAPQLSKTCFRVLTLTCDQFLLASNLVCFSELDLATACYQSCPNCYLPTTWTLLPPSSRTIKTSEFSSDEALTRFTSPTNRSPYLLFLIKKYFINRFVNYFHLQISTIFWNALICCFCEIFRVAGEIIND